MQRKIISALLKIICFIVIFIIFLEIRAYWDSYRFYKIAVSKEKINLLESIRYYGASIKSYPSFSKYKRLSEERLKQILKNVKDERIKMMIKDELFSGKP